MAARSLSGIAALEWGPSFVPSRGVRGRFRSRSAVAGSRLPLPARRPRAATGALPSGRRAPRGRGTPRPHPSPRAAATFAPERPWWCSIVVEVSLPCASGRGARRPSGIWSPTTATICAIYRPLPEATRVPYRAAAPSGPMTTPIVTEIPARLEAVTADPFVADLGAAASSPAAFSPVLRSPAGAWHGVPAARSARGGRPRSAGSCGCGQAPRAARHPAAAR